MERFFFFCGSISAFLAVAFGAFGAHLLKNRLTSEMADIFEVGVRYHMFHALALLAVGWAISRRSNTSLLAAGWLFLFGTVVFSGSLYLLSLTGLRWLGAITPIGGAAFLLGWLCLAWGSFR
jgi:uncharacterized membrane protein YgdD (TMEM256/DUF423 family)